LYAAEYESLASSVLVVIFATVVYRVACLSLDILLVASPEWADGQIVGAVWLFLCGNVSHRWYQGQALQQ
jgi:hypothetical protein